MLVAAVTLCKPALVSEVHSPKVDANAGEDLQSHGEEDMAGPSGAEGEPIEQDFYDGGDGFAGDDDDGDGGAMQPLEPAEAAPPQGAEPPWCEGKQSSCISNQRNFEFVQLSVLWT